MRVALILLMLVHGAIHLLGFAKAFELAEVAQLHTPISRNTGLLWLLAAVLFVASAVLLGVKKDLYGWWWMTAAPAVVVSQALVIASWGDAKFGTLANVVLAVPLVLSLLDLRPSSFHSRFERDATTFLGSITDPGVVTAKDLEKLPPEVATYLRRAGVVGRPRVHDFRARFRVDMRPSLDAGWMKATAEQVEVFEGTADEPVRLFLMEGTMKGLPFAGYHRFAERQATMQIRAAGLFDVVDARGPEMNQSETVTLFNDMCVLAPATLIDAAIEWEPIGPGRVRATFHHIGVTIHADLFFDEAGDLVDFISGDRFLSADGKKYERHPWQTPLSGYRDFGNVRLAAKGLAIWKRPPQEGGDFTYGRFTIEEIAYNVAPRSAERLAVELAR